MNRPRPVKVLHVLDTLGVGGAETWLMALLRHWSRTGDVQTAMLLTSGDRGVFDDEARQLGADLHYVRFDRSHLPQFTASFRKLLAGDRYQAIHDHQDYLSGWHFLFGAGRLPPVRVTHVHKPGYQIRENYGVTFRRRVTANAGKHLVARLATHITGTSWQSLREHGFVGPIFERIPVGALYCGIEVSRFVGDPSTAKSSLCAELDWPYDSKIILFAGRIDQQPEPSHPQTHKNSAFASSVAIECARRDPRIRMIFAGAWSPAVPALEAQIAEAGLQRRIRFLGIRNDIPRLMLASDVLLFPSRGEALGMVAVEAQAAGLPVLASTAVPAECVVVPELVRFQDVEAGSQRWASDVLDLIDRKRDVLAANRKVSASPFAIEHSAQALLKLYGEGVLG